MDTREERMMLTMAREAKQYRDEDGIADPRADHQLQLFEAGIFAWPNDVDPMTIDPATWQGKRGATAQPVTDDDGVWNGRRGGAPARNQFGDAKVHTASPKQVAYIRRLIAERDTDAYSGVGGKLVIPADLDTISKTGASTLIDKLMACPVKDGPAVDTSGASAPRSSGQPLATDKQLGYLRKLIAERDYFSLDVSDRRKVDAIKDGRTPTQGGRFGADRGAEGHLARRPCQQRRVQSRPPAQ